MAPGASARARAALRVESALHLALERQAKKPTITARHSEQGFTESIRLQLTRMLEGAREARDTIEVPLYVSGEPASASTQGDASNKIKKHLDSAIFHMQRLCEADELLMDGADR